MRGRKSGPGRKLLIIGLLLAAVVGGAWWQRQGLLAWYALRGLAETTDAERDGWVTRVAELELEAVPGLIALLREENPKVCVNATAALGALRKRWGPGDSRTTTLAEALATGFTALSNPGREATLEWHAELLRELDLQSAAARPVVVIADNLVVAAVKAPTRGIRLRGLVLAEILLGRGKPAHVDGFRQIALANLADPDSDIRAQAIRLTLHEPLHSEKELLDRVVPCLRDGAAEVRRAAVLCVGLAEEAISVEEMLPLLQDADAEVRHLCEVALRGRGLQNTQIELARLLTDQRPDQRLQVVNRLLTSEDVDRGLWLRHLSHDSAPAVRAAALRAGAVRFASEEPNASDFLPRMRQMSLEDPSPTVRHLAEFYLSQCPQ